MNRWYRLFTSTRRKAKPAVPRVTKLTVNASRWLYHGPPAWTDEPGDNCITPPVKATGPASIVQISFTLSLKLSASQPILIMWSPWSTTASWNVLAPHPRVELNVQVGSTYNGYRAWASMSEFNVTFRMPFAISIDSTRSRASTRRRIAGTSATGASRRFRPDWRFVPNRDRTSPTARRGVGGAVERSRLGRPEESRRRRPRP